MRTRKLNPGNKSMVKQEYIAVGCVTPAAVAVTGGLHTPPEQAPPWEQTPLEQGPPPEQTPQAKSLSTSPLVVGLETPLARSSSTSPPGCGPGNLQSMLG